MDEVREGFLDYDDVAEYVFNALVACGYAPSSDEVLDIADFMFDFILMMFQTMGVDMVIHVEMENDEEEE